MKSQLSLLKNRRFAPLMMAQFLGAFHDNLFKNAFVVLILYESAAGTHHDPKIVATLAAAIFILPFVLFSALGGELADKYPKNKVISTVKLAEIVIAALGTLAIFTSSVYLSYAALFFLGTHSALFGPSRYAIIPEHLERGELIAGNALINACIFVAILLGTIIGAALITQAGGKVFVSGLLFACALAGYIAGTKIPQGRIIDPGTTLHFNPFVKTPGLVRGAMAQPQDIRASILGIGWFYFLGSMFLSQFPNYARQTLLVDETVLTLFLAVFSVGIALGGLCNSRLLRNTVSAAYVPFAMGGITVFSVDLYFASLREFGQAHMLAGLSEFLGAAGAWRILFDTFMIALCGGLFEVPLNTILQHRVPENIRARVLAGSAIINALFIIASSVFAALLLFLGCAVHTLFLIFAGANILAVLFLYKNLLTSR